MNSQEPNSPKPNPQASDPGDVGTLQVIESTRGGRHWVNETTAAPLAAPESLQCFELPDEIEIQLFASEPLVMDPVAITFDPAGRMFVVEYGDYPTGPDEGEAPLSRIVLLEDTDADGRADKRTVFADKLNFCHSAMYYRDGLLIGEQTRIVHLRDTNGNNVADRRDVLFDGFTPAHPQMQIGNPRWGIDNWIYCNYGPGKITTTGRTEAVAMPRKDFCFDPGTMQFRADGGWGQFGNTVDRFGRRFYCTNRNPIITTLMTPEEAHRNPFFVTTQTSYDVGAAGGATRVYPRIKMKSNYLSHAGTHTAACGVTAFTGHAMGSDSEGRPYQDSIFVCEPIGHLVTRSLIRDEGARLTAERPFEKRDFLTSTDPWFRPASLATGPDGALYLADMYRLWVEHPKFLPPEIAAKLDWRAGEDRGRVYRLVSKTAGVRESLLPGESPRQSAAALESPNGWTQFLGQQRLVERQATEAVPLLKEILQHSKSVTARLHALCTLDALDSSLDDETLITALQDSDALVRQHAVRLSRSRFGKQESERRVLAMATDPSPKVRLEVAFAIGDASAIGVQERSESAIALAKASFDDSAICDALLTSARQISAACMLVALSSNQGFVDTPSPNRVDLIKDLASIVGARGDSNELVTALDWVCGKHANANHWWQFASISGLADGLRRHRGGLGRTTLSALLSRSPTALAPSLEKLSVWLEQRLTIVTDENASLAERTAAIDLLRHQGLSQADAVLERLVVPGQPAEIQAAAVSVIALNTTEDRCQLLLKEWGGLSPAARTSAISVLLRRTETTEMFLRAVESGRVSGAMLTIDQRVRLLKNRNESLRNLAASVLGGAISDDRREVARKYQIALHKHGSPKAGAAVFQKTCAVCHRFGNVGHTTGPDLSDAKNRSTEALLYDILDPNSKVDPRYTSYSILTTSGDIYSGLIIDDAGDQIVMQMAEDKRVMVARDEIENLKSNDVSLMPEGIEKEISPEQMADLLAFLTARQK